MKKLLLFLGLAIALVSCTPVADDIINPDAEYLYFYGKTCPHCQEVNAYMKENHTHANYSIEKREVYQNTENQKMFQVVTASLGIPEGTVWVPFVVNKATWEYVIGTDPVKELFPPTPVVPVEEAEINTTETAVEPEISEIEAAPAETIVEAEISSEPVPEIINE